jgi:hypothetical protein
MLGETDARRDDLGSGESSPVDGDAGEGITAPVPAEADPDEIRDVPEPPVTGDEAVDEAMARLAEAQPGSFAERIEAGEHAHRSLQSRLGGLGGA